MLKNTIVAVGKLKEKFWKDACQEYLKRLGAYAKVSVCELPDSNKEKEAAAILEVLPDKDPVLLLDIKGKEVSSEQLSEKIDSYSLYGTSHLVFVIGGSDGVTKEIKERASERISFGPITLPHNLARVVLLEQIYRAFKISRKEPYHK
ncbi:MAG: 23S rRNA (pseudouridine(1915)-N(3))-methyltransferase RlmH [Anaerotardibacter sp.]